MTEGTCPSCGEPHRAGAKFCSECGAPLATQAGGEVRKTVTAVFADVVGSTAFQEAMDPEAAHHVMERFYVTMRDVLEAHGGRVSKFIGDAVVALFGFPAVREDDALRGVRAAAAMRDALAPLNDELERRHGVRIGLRLGVNTGEVVISAGGLAIGDAMNTAARLEQSAPEGEVLIGETTWRHVRDAISCEPVEPLVVKGKSEPLPAWRLIDVASAPVRLQTRLVGRATELRRLREAFDAAVEADACRLITIVGSPGLGKTRLATEFAASCAGRAQVLEGRCEPTGEGMTWAPVAEVLRGAAAIGDTDAPDVAREKLAGLLPDDPDRELLVERAAGILGLGDPAAPEETFWSVRRLLGATARDRPLVVILDDVHWGQPTFLDLVEHLAEWGRQSPILLVALARPELREMRPALAAPGRLAHDVIELSPLRSEDSRRLVGELLDQGEVPDVLASRLLQTTEGNPLFLGETVRMLVDDGVLQREGDHWVVAGDGDDVEVPPTIHALLAARIERLGDHERMVVERASVIGKQFYRGAVAELSPPPVAENIDGALAGLQRKEVVEPEGTFWIDEPVFRFHHVLIRDAAYRTLLKEARADLHERFADWLAGKAGDLVGEHEEVIAFHLEQAHGYLRDLGPLDTRGVGLGERAAAMLHSAGRRALAREDLPAAANLLSRASALAADATVEVDLLEALLSAGETAEVPAALERLRAVAGEDPRADVAEAQLLHLTDSTRLHETLATLGSAAARLAAAGDDAGVAKAHHVRAQGLALLGRVAEVEAALDEALAAARRAQDSRRVTAVLSGAPRAALWGPSPVMRASGRCLDVVRILRMTQGNRHVEAVALRCQAVLEAMRGRTDAARQILDRCRMTLEELGLTMELLETSVHAGIVELVAGDAAAAEAPLRAAHDGFRERGLGVSAAGSAALLARALLEQGRTGEAEALTHFSEQHAGEDLKTSIAWRGVRAQLLSAAGDHDEALRLAQEAVELAAATDALVDHGDARMDLAHVLRSAGRAEQAAAEARRAGELYAAKGSDVGAQRAAEFAGRTVAAAPPPTARNVPTGTPATINVLGRRLNEAINAQDWDALDAVLAPDLRVVERRRPAVMPDLAGRDALIEQVRSIFAAAGDARCLYREIAAHLDAALVEATWVGHLDDGGGPFSTALLMVCTAQEGRFQTLELFDPGDEEAARRRLGELSGSSSPVIRLGLACADAINRRDWEFVRSRFADDLVTVDHRRLRPLAGPAGPDAWIERVATVVEMSGDVRYDWQGLEDREDAGLLRAEWIGHADDTGGAFENPMLVVCCQRDGLWTRFELFDVDDEAAARRRLEELTAAPPLVLGRQITDAINARDWDGVRSCLAEGFLATDHRKPAVFPDIAGADAWVRWAQTLVGMASDTRIAWELLEVGPTALLGRGQWSGHQDDSGAHYANAFLLVCTMRGGRFDRFESFNVDDEDQARARFHELTNQVDRAAGVRRRAVEAINARDWGAIRRLFVDDVPTIDHRTLMPLDGPQGTESWIARVRSLVEMARDVRFEYEELLEHDGVALGRARWAGHADETGGAFATPFLLLSVLRDGRFVHLEQFDAEDDASARRRFEELSSTSRTELLNRRMADAFHARDFDAMRRVAAEDVVTVDHRSITAIASAPGREGWLGRLTHLVSMARDVRYEFRVLDERDGVGLTSAVWAGHADDTGAAFHSRFLSLSELRDDDVAVRFEIFDVDDEEQARRRLEELAEGGSAARLFARAVEALHRRDWPALRGLYADDLVTVGHRRLSPVAAPSGADGWIERVQVLVGMAGDVRFEYRVLHQRDDVVLVAGSWAGHADDTGAEFSQPLLLLCEARAGRLSRFEVFDAEDEPAARRRFEELTAVSSPAMAVAERVAEAIDARDWDALRRCYHDDVAGVEHRRLVPVAAPLTADATVDRIKTTVAMSADVRWLWRRLDERDDVGMIRVDLSGHADDTGGEFRNPFLDVFCVRDGRVSRFELFDADDEAAARRRFEELAGGPAVLQAGRLITAAINAQDWDWVLSLLADDLRVADHRRPAIMPPTTTAAEWVAYVRHFFGIAEDLRFEYDLLDATDANGFVRARWVGHSDAGGGPFASEWLMLTSARDGRLTALELFEPDDEEAARWRFDELASGWAEDPVLGIGRRVADAVNARDWTTAREQLAGDLTVVDRRRPAVMPPTSGAGAWISYIRQLIDVAADTRYEYRVLGARGGAGVTHARWVGHADETGAEYASEFLMVCASGDGRFTRFEVFDVEDEERARARFEELAADDGHPMQELLHIVAGAINRRDWDAVRALYAEDMVTAEHRTLTPLPDEQTSQGWMERVRWLFDLSSDLQVHHEVLAVRDDHILLRGGWHGHVDETGAAYDMPFLVVAAARDGRIVRQELFDVEDEAAARARLEKLTGPAPVSSAPGRGDFAERAPALARETPRERTIRKLCDGIDARDWEAVAALAGDRFVVRDHRKASVIGDVDGIWPWLERVRSMVDAAPDVHLVYEHLAEAGEAGLTRVAWLGHWNGGGPFEIPFLNVHRVQDGHVELMEIFDERDEEAARRRLDDLAQKPPAQVIEADDEARMPQGFAEAVTAQSDDAAAAAHRLMAALTAADWPAVEALITPDFSMDDTRPLSTWVDVRDATGALGRVRSLYDSTLEVRYELDVVAANGGAVAGVTRTSGRLKDGGGPFELTQGMLLVRRGERFARAEFFEPDDRAGLLAAFEDAQDPSVVGVLRELYAALEAQDWRAAKQLTADDLVVVDHRPLSTWHEVRGREAAQARVAALAENATGLRFDVEILTAGGPVAGALVTITGELLDGGGAFEEALGVVVHEREGLLVRFEFVDGDRRAVLLLSAAHRMYAALSAQDWDELYALVREDLDVDDRRSPATWHGVKDREAARELITAMAENTATLRHELRVLAHSHHVVAGLLLISGTLRDGDGPFEHELGVVLHADDDARFHHFDFMPADEEQVLARFRECVEGRTRDES